MREPSISISGHYFVSRGALGDITHIVRTAVEPTRFETVRVCCGIDVDANEVASSAPARAVCAPCLDACGASS